MTQSKHIEGQTSKSETDQGVTVVEVGPRDGLQNETAPVPTTVKVAFVDVLSEAGLREIEVSAFVSPGWVPQLGDAEDVFHGIARREGVVYSALVPNQIGLERAIEAGADKIAIFTAASETFNRKNINTSIAGSIRRFKPVVKRARQENLPVRAYVSAAFWCAFEGKISPPAVIDVVQRLIDIGADEISVSDTLGKATPQEVDRLLDHLLPILPANRIAMHFHDTYGRGVENAMASWSAGIRIFDASAGGLGGCPYAPGATGNVATEALVSAFEGKGIKVGVDLHKLARAEALISTHLVDDRRAPPEAPLLACSACAYATGKVCCRRREMAQ
jgi:hydroxymethylglutaryl-CoA lyase